MRIRGLVRGMLSKAKHLFCRKLIIEWQAGLSKWRSQAKKVSGMMSIKLKSCDFQPVFCRLQEEVAFQALEKSSTGKTGERVKEKADKNVKLWGLQKGAATRRKELKSKRRSCCFVQARTVRQWKDGVTRAMCLRDELGRRSQQ